MKKKGIEALAHEAARMLKSGADVDALSDRFCNKTTRALVTAGAFLWFFALNRERRP